MTRKKRQLTDDEHVLWQKVTSTARPLEGRKIIPQELPRIRAGSLQETKVISGRPRAYHSATESQLPPQKRNDYVSDSKPGTALSNLDRRASRLLGRGRARIDARLDLHGMTQSAAHSALQAFLFRTRRHGSRYVLVITGKSGILNRLVPHWLAEPQLRIHVSGVTTAAARHGGHGALYIRLRRND